MRTMAMELLAEGTFSYSEVIHRTKRWFDYVKRSHQNMKVQTD